jgi:hypothetical protein
MYITDKQHFTTPLIAKGFSGIVSLLSVGWQKIIHYGIVVCQDNKFIFRLGKNKFIIRMPQA